MLLARAITLSITARPQAMGNLMYESSGRIWFQ
jgi:hypothetical protein